MHVTSRARTHRLLNTTAILGLAVTLTLAGCGNSDDAAGGVSDEEFCARLIVLEQQADTDEELGDAEAIALFRELADQAPDREVGTAIDRLGDLVEQLSAIDDDDPNAFAEAMGLMFDPRLVAAGDTLDAYLTGTCGLETSSFGDLGISPGEDDDGELDFSGPGWAMDDLSAEALREALADDFAEQAPDNNGTGIAIFGRGSATVVDAQVYETEILDPVALCEALAAAVDASTTDPEVVLEVSVDGTVVAAREAGGACTEV